MIQGLIDRIRDPNTRWDAIIELKLRQNLDDIVGLLKAVDDADWMVRWCVAEKLGELGNPTAIPHLTRLLMDQDPHVRKNAIKALIRFGPEVCGYLVTQLGHPHFAVRRYIGVIIRQFGSKAIPFLVREFGLRDWVSANHIVHLLYFMEDPQKEERFIKLLEFKDVKKSVLLMLGGIKSVRSIPVLCRLYGTPSLRQPLLATFHAIGLKSVGGFLVKGLDKGNPTAKAMCQQILIALGEPILPHLLPLLSEESTPKARVIAIMEQIGPLSIMAGIHKLADRYPDIHRLTRDMRQKYPVKSERGGIFDIFS